MDKYVKKLVDGYNKFTVKLSKFRKIVSPGTTLNQSKPKEPIYIDQYRSFWGQIMCYTTKVVHDVENTSRELAAHISHPQPEHWKALGHFIGYLKGKETKGITIRNPKVLKAVVLCNSNYAMDKETRNSVSIIFATLGGTLLKCPLKTQRTIALSIMEAEYVALLELAQEVIFFNMLLQEIKKVKKPEIVHK